MIARVKITRIFTVLIAGENVSWKSNLNFCLKPLATNLAFYLFILPSEFSLTLNTHLHPIAFLWGGRGTRVQVLFLLRAWNSSVIAENHLESWSACFTDLGSVWTRSKEGWILGCTIPALALVTIGCTLSGLTREVGGEFWGLVGDNWGWALWHHLPRHTYKQIKHIKILINKFTWVKGSHLLHYYQIRLIKNIFGSKQGHQSLQKNILLNQWGKIK